MRCQVCNEKIEEENQDVLHAGLCNACRNKIIENLEKGEWSWEEYLGIKVSIVRKELILNILVVNVVGNIKWFGQEKIIRSYVKKRGGKNEWYFY